jgi:hypothetical protein
MMAESEINKEEEFLNAAEQGKRILEESGDDPGSVYDRYSEIAQELVDSIPQDDQLSFIKEKQRRLRKVAKRAKEGGYPNAELHHLGVIEGLSIVAGRTKAGTQNEKVESILNLKPTNFHTKLAGALKKRNFQKNVTKTTLS